MQPCFRQGRKNARRRPMTVPQRKVRMTRTDRATSIFCPTRSMVTGSQLRAATTRSRAPARSMAPILSLERRERFWGDSDSVTSSSTRSDSTEEFVSSLLIAVQLHGRSWVSVRNFIRVPRGFSSTSPKPVHWRSHAETPDVPVPPVPWESPGSAS